MLYPKFNKIDTFILTPKGDTGLHFDTINMIYALMCVICNDLVSKWCDYWDLIVIIMMETDLSIKVWTLFVLYS